MKTIEIARHATPEGNFGQLFVDGRPVCLTLERPWVNNRVNVSCIPPGEYYCERVIGHDRFGETFRVVNVEGRSGILFHTGNLTRHSKGCIIFGSTYGEICGCPAVQGSGEAKRKFMALMEREVGFNLVITGGAE